MVMRVQRIGDEFHVVLPAGAMEAMHLLEGGEVEVRPVAAEPSAPVGHTFVHATLEEVMESYRKTEPFHRNTYRELAK